MKVLIWILGIIFLFLFCSHNKPKENIAVIDYYIGEDSILVENINNNWLINKKYPGDKFIIERIITFYDSLDNFRNFKLEKKEEYLGGKNIKMIINFVDTLFIGRKHPVKNLYYVVYNGMVYLVPFRYIVQFPTSLVDFVDKNQIVDKSKINNIVVHCNNRDFVFFRKKSNLWYFGQFRANKSLVDFLLSYFDKYNSDENVKFDGKFLDYIVFNNDTVFYNDTIFYNQYNKLIWKLSSNAPIFREYFFNIERISNDIFAYNNYNLMKIKIKDKNRFFELDKDSLEQWYYYGKRLDIDEFLSCFYSADFRIVEEDTSLIDDVVKQHPEYVLIFIFRDRTEILSIYNFRKNFYIRNSLDKYLFTFPQRDIIIIERFISQLK